MPFVMRRSQKISYTQAQSSTFDKLPKLPKIPESGFAGVCGSLRVFASFLRGVLGAENWQMASKSRSWNLSARE